MQMVRDALGPEVQDILAPEIDGGVRIHKIFGLMHDNCATANLVAELMAKLRDDEGREYHGVDVWDGKDNKAKPMFDFLCGNHTRNLLTVRFEKRHDKFLEEELGEALRVARAACGGRARLERSGTHFLRSLCKLTHKGMLCHNNNAERPFAVVRSYKRMYPSISLCNLSRLSQTLVSGSHLPAEKGQLAGVALTADPRLRACIGILCGVRRVKVGKTTQMLRAAHTVDTEEMIATRKRKSIEKYQANLRKKTKKAALQDYAEEVADNSLVTDTESFQIKLLARGNSSKARISFLKDQFHARISGDNSRHYTSLGCEFRQKHGKLRLTCKDKSMMTEEAYLVALITAMIADDADALGVNANNSKLKDEFIR
jgi:hypothetical protein